VVRGPIVRVAGRVGETLGALSVALTGAAEVASPASLLGDHREDELDVAARGAARHVRC
jgi:hypothetical protein